MYKLKNFEVPDKVRFGGHQKVHFQNYDFRFTYLRLVHLQKLILNDCPLTEISIPAADAADEECHFPALEMLSVVNTKLTDWMSMSALDNLPKLKILIMMGCRSLNPKTKSQSYSPHFKNQLVFGKIGGKNAITSL